jgi:hypothetical protein
MPLEDIESDGKGFSAGHQELDWKVAQLLSHINEDILEPKGPLNEQARQVLKFIGEDRLGPDMIKLLKEARGYKQMDVTNPNYRGLSSTVLYKEGFFAELLVDNSGIAAVIDPERDRRKHLPYLSYLKVERSEIDRYVHHIRTMTGNRTRSAWAVGKQEGVTAAIASGAVASGASGHGELAIFLGCSSVLYYLGTNVWHNFQLSRAYEHFTTLAHGEEREVGIAALLSGLGKDPKLYGL